VSAARRVMVYSSVSFFTDQIGESWMDNDVLLWLAHYGRTPGQPGYTSPRVAIHQYSQTGAVAGVAGHCDLNFALMPLHELEMDLTPDEHNMLVDLHNWISTPVQTWPYGSDDPFESAAPEHLTPWAIYSAPTSRCARPGTRCGPWNPQPPRRLSWRRRPLCPS